METLIIVRDAVGAVPYWAADESLPLVRSRFKRLSGKFPSKKASIVAFTGSVEDIDKIRVDDLGSISYPKTVSRVELQ